MSGPARRAGFALAALAIALPSLAAEPRSAIPWLSQSIELSTSPPPPPRGGSSTTRGADDTITVTPLGSVSRDAVGLLPPSATGFAQALWGPDSAADVRALIVAHDDAGVPEAKALFHRLLLAEADPPRGASDGSSVLVARIDRLLAIGALEEAGALIDRAGPDTPELFRRWFDVGLLLDRAAPPCAALRQNPSLSPTLPARVFCLARGGDWNAAEITLTLGEEVGSIPPDEQALLARFLDPELFEEEEGPPVPEPLTALDFLMREAVALPRPAGALPLAFLHTDLDAHTPMRSRIDAAERLSLAGAVGVPVLLDAYRSGEPAASGGLWDRARAIQALDAALASGSDVGPALLAADAGLSARGLRVALAQGYATELAQLDSATLPDPARRSLVELLLLAGSLPAARIAAGPTPEPRTAALLAIVGAGPVPDAITDERLTAALQGLTADTPADDREQQFASMLGAGRQGQAILAALDIVQSGANADPPALRAAVLTLRLAGQTESARKIALQALIAGAG